MPQNRPQFQALDPLLLDQQLNDVLAGQVAPAADAAILRTGVDEAEDHGASMVAPRVR